MKGVTVGLICERKFCGSRREGSNEKEEDRDNRDAKREELFSVTVDYVRVVDDAVS